MKSTTPKIYFTEDNLEKNPHVLRTLNDPALDGWIYLTRFDDADGAQLQEGK